jgi:ATP-dependent RNA helicase SUPV3L1/SUV3
MEKFERGIMRRLYPPQIKQIAGRAGRYRVASAPEEEDNHGGLVTTFSPADQKFLREGIEQPNPVLGTAYLWPPFKVFEKFSQQFPEGVPLATLVSQFSLLAHTTPHYTIISSESQIALAQVIEEDKNIDLETRYNLTFTPIKTRSNTEVVLFKRCAEAYAHGKPITIENHTLDLPFHIVGKEDIKMTSSKLHSLETLHKMVMSYCWLA